MRTPDVNPLLYAVNTDSPQHPAARAWLRYPAALAIEHGAELGTSDRDFSRFAGLRVTLLK